MALKYSLSSGTKMPLAMCFLLIIAFSSSVKNAAGILKEITWNLWAAFGPYSLLHGHKSSHPGTWKTLYSGSKQGSEE